MNHCIGVKMCRLSRLIDAFEQEYREKYFSALSSLKRGKFEHWLDLILEKNIIPSLGHIGLDKHLCQTLFQIAAPSWQLMGPVCENTLLHNRIKSMDLEEIRRSFLCKAQQQAKISEKTADMDAQQLYMHTQEGMDPKNLDTLLSTVGTSWIILPRAYSLLKKENAHCLIHYLVYLNKEDNAAFRKIIIRIIIEFLANYSLKYLRCLPQREQIMRAVYYGYASMFCKNLKRPPEGLEDEEIYHYFLTWAKAYLNRSASLNTEMTETVEQMEALEKEIFSPKDCLSLPCDAVGDSDGLLITLRHGSKGVKAVSRYFGIADNTRSDLARSRLQYPAVPKALGPLVREIIRNYATETPRTRESITEVMLRIRNAYDIKKKVPSSNSQQNLYERLRFVGPRVVQIVDDVMNKNRASLNVH